MITIKKLILNLRLCNEIKCAFKRSNFLFLQFQKSKNIGNI